MSEHAIVTGGATGIGKAVAYKLASRGIDVLIADINTSDGEQVVKDIKSEFSIDAVFVKTDISNEDDETNMVKTAVHRWGRIDYACNNAGVAEQMEPHEDNVTVSQFDK